MGPVEGSLRGENVCLFAHMKADMEWALVKICCLPPFQWPRLLLFLPIQPKRTQFKRNKSPCLLGNADGLSPPHQPSVPCSTPALFFLSLEPFPDPQSQHREASQWHPGAFSRWPQTKQEEQQLVLLIQQIPSFKGYSWKKVDGVRSGWRTNEREHDMKRKQGAGTNSSTHELEKDSDLEFKSYAKLFRQPGFVGKLKHFSCSPNILSVTWTQGSSSLVWGFLVRLPGDSDCTSQIPRHKSIWQLSKALGTAVPSSSAGSHRGCFFFNRGRGSLLHFTQWEN